LQPLLSLINVVAITTTNTPTITLASLVAASIALLLLSPPPLPSIQSSPSLPSSTMPLPYFPGAVISHSWGFHTK
jgi:hypothetical protein